MLFGRLLNIFELQDTIITPNTHNKKMKLTIVYKKNMLINKNKH